MSASDNGETRERGDAIAVDNLVVKQGILGNVTASRVQVHQGAAVQLKAAHVEARQAAVVIATADEMTLEGSSTGLAVSRGKTTIAQSPAGAVVSTADVALDQSAAAVVAGKHVQVKDSHSVFVVAGKVEGEVQSTFGVKETIAFGLAAGAALVIGAWLLPKAAVAVTAAVVARGARRDPDEDGADQDNSPAISHPG